MPTLLIGFYHLIVYGNLKTVNIMANVRLKFYGNDDSENHSLECYVNYKNQIYININMEDSGFPESWICLDIPTAIKLSKVLRQAINNVKNPIL